MEKSMRKLTQREKILLAIVVVVGVVTYFMI
jgi:cell division protein FtsL